MLVWYQVHDPEGVEEAKKLLPKSIVYCESIDDAIKDADAIVLTSNHWKVLNIIQGYSIKV
jgi:UDPglucose 6-dehydrogenase